VANAPAPIYCNAGAPRPFRVPVAGCSGAATSGRTGAPGGQPPVSGRYAGEGSSRN
jgi:hypothetical protein